MGDADDLNAEYVHAYGLDDGAVEFDATGDAGAGDVAVAHTGDAVCAEESGAVNTADAFVDADADSIDAADDADANVAVESGTGDTADAGADDADADCGVDLFFSDPRQVCSPTSPATRIKFILLRN